MVGTAQDYIAQLDARLGKPYSEVIDGGVGPDYYDCSGLTEVCLNAIGIPYTRSTYTQWADPRYLHFGPYNYGAALPALQVGDVLYMHADGEEDPGHVGTYDGSGVYIDAPHTGAFVRIEEIPNTPGEHVFGIIRPPFAVIPPPIPPTKEENETVFVLIINDQTHVYAVVNNVACHWWQFTAGPDFTWHPEPLPAV